MRGVHTLCSRQYSTCQGTCSGFCSLASSLEACAALRVTLYLHVQGQPECVYLACCAPCHNYPATCGVYRTAVPALRLMAWAADSRIRKPRGYRYSGTVAMGSGLCSFAFRTKVLAVHVELRRPGRAGQGPADGLRDAAC